MKSYTPYYIVKAIIIQIINNIKNVISVPVSNIINV